MSLYFALKLLHVVSMTFLFAGSFGTALDIRATVVLGAPHATALIDRVTRRRKLVGASGAVTTVTGIALVMLGGGLHGTAMRFWIGFALAMVMAALGAGWMRGTWRQISGALATPGGQVPVALTDRYVRLDRVHTVMWISVVILMVVPIG